MQNTTPNFGDSARKHYQLPLWLNPSRTTKHLNLSVMWCCDSIFLLLFFNFNLTLATWNMFMSTFITVRCSAGQESSYIGILTFCKIQWNHKSIVLIRETRISDFFFCGSCWSLWLYFLAEICTCKHADYLNSIDDATCAIVWRFASNMPSREALPVVRMLLCLNQLGHKIPLYLTIMSLSFDRLLHNCL